MTANAVGWRFDHTYAQLPKPLFEPAKPALVREPKVVVLNHRLARELGLDFSALTDTEAAAIFSGMALPDGALPIAQAYAGHQFGGFTMLGDGRAMLWAEHVSPSGNRVDLQFKGSGPTHFSRRGDGRAALGPMLREYIIGEAMAGLGIPTTRALAVVTTGQPVFRDRPLRGAILTRVAASHIRVGTFQYAAARGDVPTLRALADYTIARHDPDLVDSPEKYRAFLRAVITRQAQLIAQWQLVGFVHGVMNTDNMALSGETIDYGPCAFMNQYDPATVFSSIDEMGRYAYGNQPRIGQWNLMRLAEAMLPLLHDDSKIAVEQATEELNRYPELFQDAWLAGMRRKLGLRSAASGEIEWLQQLLEWMLAAKADFTETFIALSESKLPESPAEHASALQQWHAEWLSRLAAEGQSPESVREAMQQANPLVIPRNHLVETALEAADERDDLQPMQDLVAALQNPFDRTTDRAPFRTPAPAEYCQYRTFCGT
ncbi:protein adenylyltransferase SelO [Tuwongella immobilis]|uniref:Protein nucleotidyltransferase YdiU n=1 Tax=Tuwongella immobilis TaxID=692036 RepID=A0A6C2YJD4_9BACT|nr:YdiU family protein [Tuwongella immobilis]VIP01680.1 UPF0061 protein Sinac_2759 OS=Singulisphaera acidiphila (strain ATCC BAA-1392 / DSM 18658 / VKM B-2454 / MOB10) GN=Sinac_2759 PE=3 SV=1: UPF0061 [Tuwongella immobilis]VTR99128.1 UPF0061 protein Sinac_2759 OS=Singulisphaera acidiphila (strain ATCC BAA-1392 / DSM 18658 / VKM B-2454 / MOB10) GN=Sinac_2759 PE=3 SV=1: UPF0061 [Tuwongella immobilis]